MNSIVILYPELFACYSKFSRKIANILKNFNQGIITFPDDPHGFIKRIFDNGNFRLVQNKAWKDSSVTHGIIFDDGEEFAPEADFFREHAFPFRLVPVKLTRVINIRSESQFKDMKSTPTYEYIGRGSYWGNPYSMYEDSEDRQDVIRKFRYDFERDIFPNKDKKEVYKLAGKRLGCFCKPDECHGDVLADYLNSWDDGI